MNYEELKQRLELLQASTGENWKDICRASRISIGSLWRFKKGMLRSTHKTYQRIQAFVIYHLKGV